MITHKYELILGVLYVELMSLYEKANTVLLIQNHPIYSMVITLQRRCFVASKDIARMNILVSRSYGRDRHQNTSRFIDSHSLCLQTEGYHNDPPLSVCDPQLSMR